LEITNEPVILVNSLLNTNPLFENIDSVYFQLNDASPAIDAGSFQISSGIFQDIEGNSRVQGAAPDMGAYEKR
jgi:hypothetical protein